MQPLDVGINKPFKNYARELFEQHLDKNLESCVEGKITAGGCYQRNNRMFITHSFKTFIGLPNNVDGRVRMIL